MMKWLLGALFAAALTQMAFGSTTDQLQIVSGATTITITDNGVGDTNPANGVINYSNANVNGWSIFVTVGVTGSPNTNPALDLTSLTASCGGLFVATCSADPLHIAYSDIGFTDQVTGFTTTYSSTQTGGGTTSQSAYFDVGNTILNEATLIGTVGPFSAPGGVGTVLGGSAAGPSPYSMTLDQVFIDNGGAVTFSSDGNVSGIPEPGAVALFGTVIALCASKLRRRRAS